MPEFTATGRRGRTRVAALKIQSLPLAVCGLAADCHLLLFVISERMKQKKKEEEEEGREEEEEDDDDN